VPASVAQVTQDTVHTDWDGIGGAGVQFLG